MDVDGLRGSSCCRLQLQSPSPRSKACADPLVTASPRVAPATIASVRRNCLSRHTATWVSRSFSCYMYPSRPCGYLASTLSLYYYNIYTPPVICRTRNIPRPSSPRRVPITDFGRTTFIILVGLGERVVNCRVCISPPPPPLICIVNPNPVSCRASVLVLVGVDLPPVI
jgi:hypothetical protein